MTNEEAQDMVNELRDLFAKIINEPSPSYLKGTPNYDSAKYKRKTFWQGAYRGQRPPVESVTSKWTAWVYDTVLENGEYREITRAEWKGFNTWHEQFSAAERLYSELDVKFSQSDFYERIINSIPDPPAS